MAVYPPGFEPLTPPVSADIADARLLGALRTTEQGGPGREMGVLSVPAPDFRAQVEISSQKIKDVEHRFATATGKRPTDESGRYTPDFLQYFSQGGPGYSGWAPLGAANDPKGLNAFHLKNLTAAYAEATRPRAAAGARTMAQNDPAYPPGFEPLTPPVTLTPTPTPGPAIPGFEALTPPVTLAPADTRSPVTRLYQDWFSKPMTQALTELTVGGPGSPLPGGYRSAEAEALGRATIPKAVPQTPTEAAVLAATAAAPVARPLVAGLTTVGGGLLERKPAKDIALDALMNTIFTAAPEVVGKAIPFIAGSLPGAKAAISNLDAEAALKTAGRLSPGLAQAETAGRTASERLQSLVTSGTGKAGLDAQKEAVTAAIEAAGGGQPQFVVRSLTGEPQMMTLREANAALTQIGEGLDPRHAAIASPGARKRMMGQAYNWLADEIRAGLDSAGSGLGAMWQKGQEEYRTGLRILEQLDKPTTWRPGGGDLGPEFNTAALQKALISPKVQRVLEGSMGTQRLADWINTLTRGEGVGRFDRLATGAGRTPADAALEWLRGRNSGSMGVIQQGIKSLLPNVGSQYIGKFPGLASEYIGVPLAGDMRPSVYGPLSSGLQALIDVIGQRVGSAGLDILRRPNPYAVPPTNP